MIDLCAPLGLNPHDVYNEEKLLAANYTAQQQSKDTFPAPEAARTGPSSTGAPAEQLTTTEKGSSSTSEESSAGSNNGRAKGGRPRGSTAEQKQAKQESINNAISWVADKMLKQKQASNSGRNKKGAMKTAIAEARTIFELDDNDVIKESTIVCRMESGNAYPTKPGSGASSPMLKLESVIVKICIAMQRCGKSITEKEFLPIVNSMIKETPLEKDVIQWKHVYCGYPKDTAEANLGKKYYQGFMNRHMCSPLNIHILCAPTVKSGRPMTTLMKGWLLLNRALLEDPKLLATPTSVASHTTGGLPTSDGAHMVTIPSKIVNIAETINLATGASGQLLTALLNSANTKANQQLRQGQKRLGVNLTATEQVLTVKKRTSTKLWAQGGCRLSTDILNEEVQRTCPE
jgi:hypothetical protein